MMAIEFIETALVINALLAVGMGGLIGLEREHKKEKTKVIAGVRTFPLTSLSGVLFSFLSGEVGMTFLDMGILVFGGFALILAFLKYEIHTIGITTPVALFITFLLGIMIDQGFAVEAAFITILVTLLLLTKKRLHNLARDIGR